MNDSKLNLFTLLYTEQLDQNENDDKLLQIKSNINFFSLAYLEWVTNNEYLTDYEDIKNSMTQFISKIFDK